MNPNTLKIELIESVAQAPNYAGELSAEIRPADFHTAVVVGKGTKRGMPTVDCCFRDAQGNEFVAMLTGELVKNLAAAIQGFEERTA